MKIQANNELKEIFDRLYQVRKDDGTFVGYDALAMYMEIAFQCVERGGCSQSLIMGVCRFNLDEPYRYSKFNKAYTLSLLNLLEKEGLIKINGTKDVKTISILRIQDISTSNKITKADVE